jgi:hypothetical protein
MDLRRARRVWLVIFIALLMGTACARAGSTAPSQREEQAGEPAAVRDLASIGTLQDRFEEDSGKVRLILLISPT